MGWWFPFRCRFRKVFATTRRWSSRPQCGKRRGNNREVWSDLIPSPGIPGEGEKAASSTSVGDASVLVVFRMAERNGGVVDEAAGVRQGGRKQSSADPGHDCIRKNAVVGFIGLPDAKRLVV